MKLIINQSYCALPYIFDNAKVLRQRSTKAEQHLWKMIRNRQLMGFKFRRQHPLKYFIADFYCHEALLVIELDGSIHELENIKQYDQQREAIITELGITVMRFSNDAVFLEADKLIEKIEAHLMKCKSLLH
jgi:cyclase